MLERGFFLFFEFFCNFFCNSFPRAENERNMGLKLFSLFFCLSHPVLAINNTGKRFFNFLNFFAVFFEIFLPGSSVSRIWDYFFFPFLALPNLVLAISNERNRFFKFFAIFFGIFLPRSSLNGIRD